MALLALVGWTNLVSRKNFLFTARSSLVVGNEPTLATSTLETPSA
jgi:hypothetical protein